MDKRYFSDKVVEWYRLNKRDLPWRDIRDAYKIWLSEIILQQTRVAQGLPYYLKFIDKFPTVDALAGATEQEVLRLWQGLGYYTRARNLHKCAKTVVERFNGVFPTRFEVLQTLPGIGSYTAAAIASFSSKEVVAVVDGNVFRVLSRVFGIDEAINSPSGRQVFSSLASSLIPEKNPDEYNQSIMEFGALHCTPKVPECSSCAFAPTCFANQNNLQAVLPLKIKSKEARKRYFNYFIFQKGKSLLMNKRSEKDIWHGLFDFYLVETNRSTKAEKILLTDKNLKVIKRKDVQFISKPYKHVLSHQVIQASFTLIKQADDKIRFSPAHKYYSIKKIESLPKPVLISRFLQDHELL